MPCSSRDLLGGGCAGNLLGTWRKGSKPFCIVFYTSQKTLQHRSAHPPACGPNPTHGAMASDVQSAPQVGKFGRDGTVAINIPKLCPHLCVAGSGLGYTPTSLCEARLRSASWIRPVDGPGTNHPACRAKRLGTTLAVLRTAAKTPSTSFILGLGTLP